MTKEELFYQIVINYELSVLIEPEVRLSNDGGPYKLVYKVTFLTTCGTVDRKITKEEYDMLYEAMKEKADESHYRRIEIPIEKRNKGERNDKHSEGNRNT